MKKHNLFDKSILDRKCIGGGSNYLLKEIPSYDKKDSLKRQFIQDQKAKDKKEPVKSKVIKSSNFTGGTSNAPLISKTTKFVKSIGKVKSSHIIKKSKKI
jgi:hypothetical protein